MNSEHENNHADWWQQMLTRREANARLAKIGAGIAVLSAAAPIAGCRSDDAPETTEDALTLQKEEGWNVGMTDKQLSLAHKVASDSGNSIDWTKYKDPKQLLDAYAPTDTAWSPYVVPTLVQSLAQPTLQSQIAPVHTPAMDDAYSRGLGMKQILADSEDPANTVLVVDIPGPQAVAYGAALSDVADVVMTFDNWPHPAGVVNSDQTLGALLYYAGEVEKKKKDRPDDPATVLLLDSRRLSEYTDDGDKFDNRYVAKLPPADQLKSMGVKTVLYAVPDPSVKTEADDINEDFVAYGKQGITVSKFPLSDFQPAPAGDVPDSAVADQSGNQYYHRTYYYGGGYGYAPLFYHYYPLGYRSGLGTWHGTEPRTVSRPSYSPEPRKTMFSSRTVGKNASGVGRSKPTGFGRVSTRTTSSGTRTFSTGRSSSRSSRGRSGSFGRSGGGRSM